MEIQDYKINTFQTLHKAESNDPVSFLCKTIEIIDHTTSENIRHGLKLFYAPDEPYKALFGRYWVTDLEPGKKLYKETPLNPEEMKQATAWLASNPQVRRS